MTKAEIGPEGAGLYLDFEKDEAKVTVAHGVRRIERRFGGALEFTNVLQYAEVEVSHQLDGVEAVTVGGWFFPRRKRSWGFPAAAPGRRPARMRALP